MIDSDIENVYLRLLVYFCKQNDIEILMLNQYIENYEVRVVDGVYNL